MTSLFTQLLGKLLLKVAKITSDTNRLKNYLVVIQGDFPNPQLIRQPADNLFTWLARLGVFGVTQAIA